MREVLLKELNVLLGMVPFWTRQERIKLAQYHGDSTTERFLEYLEAHVTVRLAREKLEFVNRLLEIQDEQ